MKSKINILKILESLGHIFPSDKESVIEFEKKFKEEIKQAKPKHWDNPIEVLSMGVIKNISFKDEFNEISSDGLARAAREGKVIPKDIKKKMLEDRKNAKESR